jgi:hypothetical protein
VTGKSTGRVHAEPADFEILRGADKIVEDPRLLGFRQLGFVEALAAYGIGVALHVGDRQREFEQRAPNDLDAAFGLGTDNLVSPVRLEPPCRVPRRCARDDVQFRRELTEPLSAASAAVVRQRDHESAGRWVRRARVSGCWHRRRAQARRALQLREPIRRYP